MDEIEGLVSRLVDMGGTRFGGHRTSEFSPKRGTDAGVSRDQSRLHKSRLVADFLKFLGFLGNGNLFYCMIIKSG
jgi:hypothetical protein